MSAPTTTNINTSTISGNRGLMIEEPLIFEMDVAGRSGVDLPDVPQHAERLGKVKRKGAIGLPGLTEPDVPASLSPAAHRYLRERIGFDGLIVTDELGGMRAVSARYRVGDAAVRALVAGADMVLFADLGDVAPAAEAIIGAVEAGTLAPERLADAAARVREAQGC